MEQREIKFRVFDGTNMRYPGTGFALPPGCTTAAMGGIKIEFDYDPTKEAFLMQYTGLKDKDSTEIWEGDIVGGHPHGTVYVARNGTWAQFTAILTDAGEDGDDPDIGLFSNHLEDCRDTWAVIGNIHENPDLLEANYAQSEPHTELEAEATTASGKATLADEFSGKVGIDNPMVHYENGEEINLENEKGTESTVIETE